MATQIYTPFLTLAYLKHSLKLTGNNDHDDKIVEIVDRSNEDVDNVINPFIDTPVAEADPIYPHCRTLALRKAKSIWADEELNNQEKMKTYEELYDKKMEFVIQELKGRRTSKTKTALITHDPRDDKTILPTQASILNFDNF